MDVEICSWGKGIVENEDPDAFKKRLEKKKTSQWVEKPLHGRFLRYRETEHRENVAMVEGGTF